MVRRLTKHEVVNHPTKPMKYITVRAQIVVTHVTSYDLLIRRAILYLLGVTIDFSKEITYDNLGWQIRTSCKPSLLMKLIEGQAKKSNDSLCWLYFHAFHMNLKYWKVTSMIKMKPQIHLSFNIGS